jgi:serine/threonine-protein kinase HipA
MSDFLKVMADGVRMGTLLENGKHLAFHYESSWLESPQRFPLSLSMPLALREHPHAAIEPFLWGLLPDNPQTLEEWGRRFQVSPRNAFRIIRHVGEDCAGPSSSCARRIPVICFPAARRNPPCAG